MSGSTTGAPEFTGWRAIIWPIHRHELKKLLPMLFIFFFITFSYNILRTMKDTLVVTARSSGAEVIPFIKVWMMFPGAVLLTLLFTRLSNYFTREKVFYLMMGIFLGYFFLFVFILYPNRELFHPNETADMLQQVLPPGFKGMIAMFRNWTLTTFYVMSELWGNIVLFVLFWGFANQITKMHEAKRFYALFGFAANFSGIIAGTTSVYLSRISFNPNLPFGTTPWEQSLFFLVSLVLISGCGAVAIFRWMETRVLTDPRYYDPEEAVGEKKKKTKYSLKDSFSILLKSNYLISIALIVIGYNIVINLVEVLWKDQLRELYPNSMDYNLYINQVSTIIGVVATFTALFISGNLIRKCGWTITAMITPVILLVTSVGFFGIYFFKGSLTDIAMGFFGMTPVALVVLLGSTQNILSRGAKYTVFDATKEMAFVPLSVENKIKGKAAIDGVCNRMGKSGGSVIHQSLLILFSSFAASAPYVAGVLFVVIVGWIISVRVLGKEFTMLTSTREEQLALSKEEPILTT